MGVRLLHRTTRTLRVTEQGADLLQRITPALVTLRDAVREVEASEHAPRGRLRVTTPTDIGISFLAELIGDFSRRYPEVSVDLSLTQRVVDLVAEGFDLAIRAGELRDSSLVVRRLGGTDAQLFAAPGYLERRGAPRALGDLNEHDLVLFRPVHGRTRWVLGSGARELTLDVRGRIGCDDFSFVRAAVVAGAGIGLAPRLICARDEADGRLVRVLPRFTGRLGSLHLVYPSARHIPAKVAVFRDFLLERFSQDTTPQTGSRRR